MQWPGDVPAFHAESTHAQFEQHCDECSVTCNIRSSIDPTPTAGLTWAAKEGPAQDANHAIAQPHNEPVNGLD